MSKLVKTTYPKVDTSVTVPDATPDRSLFVDIGETSGKEIDPRDGSIVPDIDCARGYWKEQNLKSANVDACDYLIARKDRKIVGIWLIDKSKRWENVSANKKIPSRPQCNDPLRQFCEVFPVADELRQALIGGEVHLGQSQNPLRGIFF